MEENLNQTVETSTQQPTLAEQNLVSMRKKLEQEERERKAAINRAEQAERALEEARSRSSTSLDDDEDEAQKKIEYLEQRLNMLEADTATSKISDFDQVVTDENLKTLERLYPDDFNSIRYNPNAKQKSKTAYNMIKNYGISANTALNSTISKNNDRIEENKKKPNSSSVGAPQQASTPLADLEENYGRRRLSDEDRERIMKAVALKKRMS
jgi:hypothetical protein